MSPPRSFPPRFAEIAAAAAVLAIPVALIAATWAPLEPSPSRAGRANFEQERGDDNSVSAPASDSREGVQPERREKKSRDHKQTDARDVATPRP